MIQMQVQCCTNCHLHKIISKPHQQYKYRHFYALLEQLALSLFQNQLTIVKNKLPQHYKPDPYLHVYGSGLNKYINQQSKKIVTYPRYGAFEIKINKITIFSKLASGRLPNLDKLKIMLLQIKEQIGRGQTIQNIIKVYKLNKQEIWKDIALDENGNCNNNISNVKKNNNRRLKTFNISKGNRTFKVKKSIENLFDQKHNPIKFKQKPSPIIFPKVPTANTIQNNRPSKSKQNGLLQISQAIDRQQYDQTMNDKNKQCLAFNIRNLNRQSNKEKRLYNYQSNNNGYDDGRRIKQNSLNSLCYNRQLQSLQLQHIGQRLFTGDCNDKQEQEDGEEIYNYDEQQFLQDLYEQIDISPANINQNEQQQQQNDQQQNIQQDDPMTKMDQFPIYKTSLSQLNANSNPDYKYNQQKINNPALVMASQQQQIQIFIYQLYNKICQGDQLHRVCNQIYRQEKQYQSNKLSSLFEEFKNNGSLFVKDNDKHNQNQCKIKQNGQIQCITIIQNDQQQEDDEQTVKSQIKKVPQTDGYYYDSYNKCKFRFVLLVKAKEPQREILNLLKIKQLKGIQGSNIIIQQKQQKQQKLSKEEYEMDIIGMGEKAQIVQKQMTIAQQQMMSITQQQMMTISIQQNNNNAPKLNNLHQNTMNVQKYPNIDTIINNNKDITNRYHNNNTYTNTNTNQQQNINAQKQIISAIIQSLNHIYSYASNLQNQNYQDQRSKNRQNIIISDFNQVDILSEQISPIQQSNSQSQILTSPKLDQGKLSSINKVQDPYKNSMPSCHQLLQQPQKTSQLVQQPQASSCNSQRQHSQSSQYNIQITRANLDQPSELSLDPIATTCLLSFIRFQLSQFYKYISFNCNSNSKHIITTI